MKFFFVRHGKTFMNMLNKGQGWLDSDLTVEGVKELQDIFSRIDLPEFDSFYSSDLGQSTHTLQIIKEYIHLKDSDNIYYLKDLRERFLGSFEGTYLEEMRLSISQQKGYSDYVEYQKENSFADYIDDTRKLDPNGYAESFNMFENRVKNGIERILNEGTKNNWENILVVGHQNSIGLIQHILLERNTSFERIELRNGEFLIFSNESGIWKQLDEFYKN